MKKSLIQFLQITKDYYQLFANQGKTNPLAWVTAFTPVELLEAFGIDYVFPESYSAVIAASGKGQKYITAAVQRDMERTLCSYSTSFNGSLFQQEGPRGIPPRPHLLIAANNQCNTLPGWWNYLAGMLNVPLFILDYPGELHFNEKTRQYILKQYEQLIDFLEKHTSGRFDEDKLTTAIDTGRCSVESWRKIIELRSEYYISCQVTFDYVLPMVIRRCDPRTPVFYQYLQEDLLQSAPQLNHEKRVLWMGYPLWYRGRRYLESVETRDIKIIMDYYSTWWNLDYTGSTWQEALVNAYHFTPLNRTLSHRQQWLEKIIKTFHIDGVIFNINKSCKRNTVLDWALKDRISLPCVQLETDMVDRDVFNQASLQLGIQAFKEILQG